MSKELKALEVVQETEILGRTIKLYGSIEVPLFLAKDVAEWIDYSKRTNGKYQVSRMLNSVDEGEKGVKSFNTLGGIQDGWFLSEDGLYECCMRSTKPIAKQMRKEIKRYLKSIRLTGGAVQQGREEDFVQSYLSRLTPETQTQVFLELTRTNKELQESFDQLMNTEGLMPINRVAKELEIGEYTLFKFLRDKEVFYRDKDGINLPYERFRKEDKFGVKEVPCRDGKVRSATYATKKGLEYVRKLLKKDGYYDVVTE